MTCPDEGRLVAFGEGLLDGADHAEVARHVDECPECALLVAVAARSDEGENTLPTGLSSPKKGDVLGRLHGDGGARKRRFRGGLRRVRPGSRSQGGGQGAARSHRRIDRRASRRGAHGCNGRRSRWRWLVYPIAMSPRGATMLEPMDGQVFLATELYRRADHFAGLAVPGGASRGGTRSSRTFIPGRLGVGRPRTTR